MSTEHPPEGFAQKAPDVLDAHLNYLNRVLDYVGGVIPDPQATPHTRCMLGQWYYGDGAKDPQYADDAVFPELGDLHVRFHRACEGAVAAKDGGRREDADRFIAEARELSSQICEALIQLFRL